MDPAAAAVVLLFLAFALQHSLSLSHPFRDLLVRRLGRSFYLGPYRLVFTLVNTLLFGLLLACTAGLPDRPLPWPGPWSGALRLLQLPGLALLWAAGRALDLSALVGLAQFRAWRRGEEPPAPVLVRHGIYGRVRHPLYLGCILVLWGEPHLLATRNRLLLTVLATLYFLGGSLLEERRLLREFPGAYRAYREEVPAWIPRIFGPKRGVAGGS